MTLDELRAEVLRIQAMRTDIVQQVNAQGLDSERRNLLYSRPDVRAWYELFEELGNLLEATPGLIADLQAARQEIARLRGALSYIATTATQSTKTQYGGQILFSVERYARAALKQGTE